MASILVPVSAYFAANGFVHTSLGHLGRRAGALGVTMSVLALIAMANMGDRPVVAAVAGGSVVAGGGLLLRMRRASTMDGRV